MLSVLGEQRGQKLQLAFKAAFGHALLRPQVQCVFPRLAGRFP